MTTRIAATASNDKPQQLEADRPAQPLETDEEDQRAYVAKYREQASFPFEIGEIVWIVKPGYRAPLGEFSIVKAHPDDQFELVHTSTGTAHSGLVEGKHLRRDPYAVVS